MTPEFKKPAGFDQPSRDRKNIDTLMNDLSAFPGEHDTREQLELLADANEILFQDIRDEAAKLKKVIAKSPTVTEAAQNPSEHLDDESPAKEDYEKNSVAMKQQFENLDVQAREKLEKIYDIRKQLGNIDEAESKMNLN